MLVKKKNLITIDGGTMSTRNDRVKWMFHNNLFSPRSRKRASILKIAKIVENDNGFPFLLSLWFSFLSLNLSPSRLENEKLHTSKNNNSTQLDSCCTVEVFGIYKETHHRQCVCTRVNETKKLNYGWHSLLLLCTDYLPQCEYFHVHHIGGAEHEVTLD